MGDPLKSLDPEDKLFISQGRQILSENKKYLSRIKFYGVFFILLIAVGIGVMYYMTTNINNIEPATNRAAGEFAVESGFTSSGVILDPKCGTGFQNVCSFSVASIGDAINKCDQFPSICNRFIYNQNEGTMSIVSLNSGLSITEDKTVSVFTRQQGITQLSESETGQSFSSGFELPEPVSVGTGSQVTSVTTNTTATTSY